MSYISMEMKRVLTIIGFVGLVILSHAQTFFGEASYYGPGFLGKKTASGEFYSQNKLTAAHKTLPLGTILKVTNAQNNRSVYVRVNDRGPYVKGRMIDVSTKAAEILGFRNKGKAYVKIEVVNLDSIPSQFVTDHPDLAALNGIGLKDSSNTDGEVADLNDQPSTDTATTISSPRYGNDMKNDTPDQPSQPQPKDVKEANSNIILNRNYFVVNNLDKTNSGYYGVQVAVFSDPADLFALLAELQAKYKQIMVVLTTQINNKTVYKLFMGKYQNRAYADALKSVLNSKFNDSFVVKYE